MITLGDQPRDLWKATTDNQGGLDHPWRTTEPAGNSGGTKATVSVATVPFIAYKISATYKPFRESVGLHKFMCIGTEKLEKRLKLCYSWLGMFPFIYLIITVLLL